MVFNSFFCCIILPYTNRSSAITSTTVNPLSSSCCLCWNISEDGDITKGILNHLSVAFFIQFQLPKPFSCIQLCKNLCFGQVGQHFLNFWHLASLSLQCFFLDLLDLHNIIRFFLLSPNNITLEHQSVWFSS